MPPPERLRAFAYVNADKAGLYRAIMRVFTAAKEEFRLHLRPDEVVAGLAADMDPQPSLEEIEAALKQLEDWGNLRSDADTSDVKNVVDFYKERRLYQLSRAGEAAELAIELYEDAIQEPGELQVAALSDIRRCLGQLESLAGQQPIDQDKAYHTLDELKRRFEELTQKAQVFLGGLKRAVELHSTDEEGFLSYKELLIDYLERFVRELIVAQAEIADAIVRVEDLGVDAILQAAVERQLPDRFGPDKDPEGLLQYWEKRWEGLRRWFHGTEAQRPQSEMLRAKARSAIPALLSAAATIHDRRVRRSDRHADLRTLARWFAQAPTDADAHRLYRTAFTLTPARHLKTNAESVETIDAELVAPQRSWLDAPTLYLTPRLRTTGRHSRPGPARKVTDRSAERARLAAIMEEQARQLERARAQLLTERTRLSELPVLERGAFDLFLELLGEALSRQPSEREPVEIASGNGSLFLRLEPINDGSMATIETTDGRLTGPDCWITIADRFARSMRGHSEGGEAAAE